ncbi:hypothetical protein [Terriglobus sp. ADX1]|uniref:hypothetical protein n=1 Tax=Terriglobus sp. ADX1 TaxID=2794063 RepID=UPI002FE5E7D7
MWIRSDEANAKAVFSALQDFGAPLSGISPSDFNEHPETVFQIGMPPARVDVLQDIPGIAFEEAWQHRVDRMADTDLTVHVISKEDLIRNKEASGRFIDLADVEKLKLSGEGQ